MTWTEVKTLLAADRERLTRTLGPHACCLSLHPSYLCAFLYRISNYFWQRRSFFSARLVWQMNFWLTGADISPGCEIGAGMLILAPAGTAMMGRAGRNLTVMSCSGFGGEMGSLADIGAGPGLPYLEDDIVLEPHTAVLGPIRVGNRVRVRAGVILTKEAPDDTVIEGPPPRFHKRSSAA